MWRGLLSLVLLLTAAVAFFGIAIVGSWVARQLTGIGALAATGWWLVTGLLVVTIAWALAHWVSPGPTKYLTVFGVIGMILLSLLSMSVLRSRDRARHDGVVNNLRQMGMELQRMKEVQPQEEPQVDTKRLAKPWMRQP
jgi:hypothetical protein